jgi:hypothetical protein
MGLEKMLSPSQFGLKETRFSVEKDMDRRLNAAIRTHFHDDMPLNVTG